ncbi:MAG: rRNA adenine N-6-methyltransferase family protein, partial [Dehalococcoidia bacterium]
MPRRSRPQPARPRLKLPARPRKSLGQHFLTDATILDRIVRESDVGPEDTVIEIGPGTGELTAHLVQAARWVIAVEIDETLARHVRRRLAAADNLHVLRTDVLDHTPAELLAQADASPPYGR